MLAVSSWWYTLCQLSIQNLAHIAVVEGSKRGSNTDIMHIPGDGDRRQGD
jgi:hypothetical protein